MRVRVLWLYGADAAGKSTVGWEIYSRLTDSGHAAAYVDIDYLGFCTPQPGGGLWSAASRPPGRRSPRPVPDAWSRPT